MFINRESDIAFVEAIEAPTIIDGLAFGTIGSYRYCCKPNELLRFIEVATRILDALELSQHEPPVLRFQR